MKKLYSIGEAAPVWGVSITTLRRWELEGKLIPERTVAGRRRYDLTKLKPELFHESDDSKRTVAYARVSSHDQDVLEIITVFNARLYGSRNRHHPKLIEGVKKVVAKESA